MAQAAVHGRGGQPDDVQERAAANAQKVGVTVQVIARQMGLEFRDMKVGVFDALAALEDDGRTDEVD